MIRIIITAGGTSEYIDSIRKITNNSTGELGSIIASQLLQYAESNNTDLMIYYIHTKTSKKPIIKNKNMNMLTYMEITNVMDLKNTTEKLLSENEINIFIHSMAVSDFTLNYSISINEMAEEIIKLNLSKSSHSKKELLNYFKHISYNQQNKQNKISSENDICLIMKKTPKVINMIKKISPHTFLIGFKLLNNSTIDTLVAAAKKQIIDNECDLVVANDMIKIKNEMHEAFIIDKNGDIIGNFDTKDHISKGIISLLWKGGLL
ncbi:MAG: phosphopantothenoylcysteine decarboxylase [Eubacteriaceae bacterium]